MCRYYPETATKPLKELKSVVRANEALIPAFVDVLFGHLRREDSDLRLCVLLLTNYFFQRTHKFRLALLDHFEDFLIFTLETDPLRYPLPRPAEAANALKKETLETVRCWIEKFALGYSKLKNAEKFLATSKNFDYHRSNAELLVERNRADLERFQNEIKARRLSEKISQMYSDTFPDVQRCMIECRTAIELIFPKFCSLDNAETSSHERKKEMDGSVQENLTERLHGLPKEDTITIILPAPGTAAIQMNSDNPDLLSALNDLKILMESHCNRLNKWLKKLAEAGVSSSLTIKLIDLKRDLYEQISRCKELGVNKKADKSMQEADSDSGDSDFVDVEEKEGYEPNFRSDLMEREEVIPEHILNRIQQMEDTEKPGPSGLSGAKNNALASHRTTETKDPEQPRGIAYGLDLKYWGQDVEPAQLARTQLDAHPFWAAPPDIECNKPNEMEASYYNTRVITYVGEMPKIERECRAHMPSGKLCPRRDRERCPIHGKIIPRDSEGFPVVEQTRSTDKNTSRSQKEVDEMDFLKDIEAATGVQLAIPQKGNRRTGRVAKKRDKSETVKLRERLQTKLFDKRALRRVSETLQQIQKARAERRFSSQFNYAITRR
ncbi:UV-stimulated scaffold protein A [Ditylenchus destructor]|nr:UV-stimulated scaffold protein A [Ditylenchus destructor]